MKTVGPTVDIRKRGVDRIDSTSWANVGGGLFMKGEERADIIGGGREGEGGG